MKNKKYHTVAKYNHKIVERGKIDIPNINV